VTSLNLKYMINNKIISMIYVDDAAVIAENKYYLQRQVFNQISQRLNMTISINETKYITIAREDEEMTRRTIVGPEKTE